MCCVCKLEARAPTPLAQRRAAATPRGAPVVSIERHAFAHDRTPLEWRRTRGRGDQFSYRVEIH